MPLSERLALGPERRARVEAFLEGITGLDRFEAVLSAYEEDRPPFDGPQDEREALILAMMQIFGEEGDHRALHEVAVAQQRCYLGVAQDVCAAADTFEAARLAGNPMSSASLGYMALTGTGTPRNRVVAANLLRYAVRDGNEDARAVLDAYSDGELDAFLAKPPRGPSCADED